MLHRATLAKELLPAPIGHRNQFIIRYFDRFHAAFGELLAVAGVGGNGHRGDVEVFNPGRRNQYFLKVFRHLVKGLHIHDDFDDIVRRNRRVDVVPTDLVHLQTGPGIRRAKSGGVEDFGLNGGVNLTPGTTAIEAPLCASHSAQIPKARTFIPLKSANFSTLLV